MPVRQAHEPYLPGGVGATMPVWSSRERTLAELNMVSPMSITSPLIFFSFSLISFNRGR